MQAGTAYAQQDKQVAGNIVDKDPDRKVGLNQLHIVVVDKE